MKIILKSWHLFIILLTILLFACGDNNSVTSNAGDCAGADNTVCIGNDSSIECAFEWEYTTSAQSSIQFNDCVGDNSGVYSGQDEFGVYSTGNFSCTSQLNLNGTFNVILGCGYIETIVFN